MRNVLAGNKEHRFTIVIRHGLSRSSWTLAALIQYIVEYSFVKSAQEHCAWGTHKSKYLNTVHFRKSDS
ncbi:Uncharacterized protein APZ42_007267 [Daphnia magna]|uniref:Uncharacterized protein n=1 Tax=Daphnia magna TaxID=35525 RepID=A0A164FE60_9CRUS|nr:Uncharacterized protein APZ42_007267 [Daphnia magna]